MTTDTPEPHRLRARLTILRHEIAETTDAYHSAKNRGDTERTMSLLRKRSALIRELFDVQSQLLATIRTPSEPAPTLEPSKMVCS